MSALRLEIVRSSERSIAAPRAGLGPLVSRQRLTAARDAGRIVDDARVEAARIVSEANKEAALVRARAESDGRADGERAWIDAARELASAHTTRIDLLERDLVRLSLEIARRIAGASLCADEPMVAALAARACAPLRRDAALVVRISPSDAPHASTVRERLGERASVVVEIDPTLEEGDCIAECAGVRVDARLDTQLANVNRRLAGHATETI